MSRLLLILLTFVMVGCSPKEYGENLDKQTKAIEDYMSKYKHNMQGGVYVRILEQGDAGAPVPTFGDTISFDYIEKAFTNEPKGVISTNIKEVAEEIGLNTPKELLVPMKIVWGVTPIIPGLKGALMWATKGEVLEAVMSFNLGYDDKWNNIVPPYTALAFDLYIVDIKKRYEK